MVNFGSEDAKLMPNVVQGLSDFETAGIAGYSENSADGCAWRLGNRHCLPKRAKTPLWAKRCRLWMGTN